MGEYTGRYQAEGDTERTYTIYVVKDGARCSCLDGHRGNRCKHIYFLLMKEINADEDDAVLLCSEFSQLDLSRLQHAP